MWKGALISANAVGFCRKREHWLCVGQISLQNENLREQRLPCTLFPGILLPQQGGGRGSFIPEWVQPNRGCQGASRTCGVRTLWRLPQSPPFCHTLKGVPCQDFFHPGVSHSSCSWRTFAFPMERFFSECSWSHPMERSNRDKFPGEVNSPHPIDFFALSQVFFWKGPLFLRNLSSSGKIPPKVGREG